MRPHTYPGMTHYEHATEISLGLRALRQLPEKVVFVQSYHNSKNLNIMTLTQDEKQKRKGGGLP